MSLVRLYFDFPSIEQTSFPFPIAQFTGAYVLIFILKRIIALMMKKVLKYLILNLGEEMV